MTRGYSSTRSKSRRKQPETTLYSRSVICSLGQVTEHQLRIWEREDLITPARMTEREGLAEPLYDDSVFDRIRIIRTLAEELEVNLPGIGVILNLLDRIAK